MANPELRMVVVDADGGRFAVDLHGQPEGPATKPSLAYDRAHKITCTVLSSGSDGPYQRSLALWLCRRPSLHRDGQPPQRIELVEITAPIAPPGDLRPPPTSNGQLIVPCPASR